MKLSLLLLLSIFTIASCIEPQGTPIARSGVSQASIKVKTDLNGKTVEQNHIIRRLDEDNTPGSIKHLYVISAYSGQVILYSTVEGKVTSSGKRISPTLLAVTGSQSYNSYNPDLIMAIATVRHFGGGNGK